MLDKPELLLLLFTSDEDRMLAQRTVERALTSVERKHCLLQFDINWVPEVANYYKIDIVPTLITDDLITGERRILAGPATTEQVLEFIQTGKVPEPTPPVHS